MNAGRESVLCSVERKWSDYGHFTYHSQRERALNDIQNIIERLEQQRAAIDNALAALREVSGTEPKKRRGRPPNSRAKKRTRNISPEGRQRQIEAMRKYWAKKKAGATKRAPKKRAAKEVAAAAA